MTKRRLFLAGIAGVAASLLLALTPSSHAKDAQDFDLDVQLIWATNDATSPDRRHKQVDAELARKLKKHHKWKNYFEVSRQQVSVGAGKTRSVSMSHECTLDIRSLGDGRLEVTLFGNKKPVSKQTAPLPAGETFIVGGDVPENDTAWLIVIKRTEKK